MAYFLTDEDQKKSGEGFATAQAPQSSTASASQQDTRKSPKSSGFTNFKSYLDANAGDVDRMADTVGSGLTSAYDSEVKDMNQAGQGQFDSLFGGKAPTDTTEFFSDPTKIEKDDFTSYYDQGKNKDFVKRDTDVFSKFADDITDNDSRKGIISDVYGNSSYDRGMKSLDSFLLGSKASELQGDANAYDASYRKQQNDLQSTYDPLRKQKDKEIQTAQNQFRQDYTDEKHSTNAWLDGAKTIEEHNPDNVGNTEFREKLEAQVKALDELSKN